MISAVRTANALLPALALVVGSLNAAAAASPSGPSREAESSLDLARRLNEAFVQVADTVSPAVVVVRVWSKPQSTAEAHSNILRFLPEEMRRELEKRLEEERQRPPDAEDSEPDQGSGVIFREDGYLITNSHVVENASRVEVRLKDGRRLPAEVRGTDPESDLAVLKVDATGLPSVKFGDSSRVRVGEFAIAIGAPFYLEYSVTFGHVSAKGRRVLGDVVMMDQDFIQTDASINPGNSGGPLVNIEGEVIGINSMIRGMNTGIGFAVPVNLVKEVSSQLIEHGRFRRAWLGVGIDSLSNLPEGARPAVPVSEGVVITSILPDGPSKDSELARRDVVVAIDGSPVNDVVDLKRIVSRKPVGKSIDLEVYRGAEQLRIQVTPGELPADRMALRSRPSRMRETPLEDLIPDVPAPTRSAGVGLQVRELTQEEAKARGLDRGEGVLVENVEDNSPASRRIREGEVITKVNRKPVRNPGEFLAAIEAADSSRGIGMTVVGEKGRRFEVVKPAAE